MRLIALMTVMTAPFCLAQSSGDFKPATSNVLDAQYPRVDSNSRVQIRFKAPDAGKVRVNFWSGPKAEMEKQADGFWTFTTPSMAPGLHYYMVVVDGAEVSDPGSTAYFGGNKWASAVEVPEAGATYYLPQDVPHGQVREVWYHSSVTGTWRRAFVYLPPDYDANTKTRYPVLYLEHGGDVNVAVSLAQSAREKAPNSPITADVLGWAYYKLGSVDLAINEFKECTQKVPANPVYRYHLGMAYMTARRFDLATQSLRAALKQAPNFQYAASANSALEKIAQQAR